MSFYDVLLVFLALALALALLSPLALTVAFPLLWPSAVAPGRYLLALALGIIPERCPWLLPMALLLGLRLALPLALPLVSPLCPLSSACLALHAEIIRKDGTDA